MAFSVPTFNLTCDVYSGPFTSMALRFSSPCNLAVGRRVKSEVLAEPDATDYASSLQMDLLLPKGTDLHDGYQGWPQDIIECPQGSGRWYMLYAYDDVGKGFDNEYRLAIIFKIGNVVSGVHFPGLFWPTPCP